MLETRVVHVDSKGFRITVDRRVFRPVWSTRVTIGQRVTIYPKPAPVGRVWVHNRGRWENWEVEK